MTDTPDTNPAWRRATAADFGWIEAVLNDPAYYDRLEAVPRPALEAALESEAFRLLAFAGPEGPLAFAYLSRCDTGRPKLEEFAVLRPGAGTGRQALAALLGLLAAENPARCLWLHVVLHNAPAIRLYRSCGFGRDELIPAAWTTRLGETVDLLRLHIDLDTAAA
ncbi:hypothetical protein FDP22_14670 [Paroceanicella profunda]|uniref:N-acetyltransferase domain-containing protein n=1 Tax=Paroceanicella profunda TaxID=2579971 RepID=A0A5B8FIB6_9RHOB|nr:GNAT family N-acetyltransferase [Paroceanicella profunda]QDL92918.1 hypothetical protein FDP22_14670 [Paroceanicella profunda]